MRYTKGAKASNGFATRQTDNGILRLDFDRRVMVQFRGSVVTSDAGLLGIIRRRLEKDGHMGNPGLVFILPLPTDVAATWVAGIPSRPGKLDLA